MKERLTFYFLQTQKQFEAGRQQEFVAGLAETCDLNFEAYLQGNLKIVSRQHFRVTYYAETGYALIDLGSLNGTAINGQKLAPGEPRFLRHGDVIQLARNPEFCIEVAIDDSNLTVATAEQPERVGPAPLPELIYDAAHDQFITNGRRVPHNYLTPLEHQLLRYFSAHENQVLTYDDLAYQIWQDDIQNNTIAKTISKLRQKLDQLDLNGPKIIQTIYGRGFRFVAEPHKDI